jgi:branched-chain amino acid transport system substrate-binding protein
MFRKWLLGSALLALAAVPAHAPADVKIGFVTTFSGPVVVIGNDMRNAFELALDHMAARWPGEPWPWSTRTMR